MLKPFVIIDSTPSGHFVVNGDRLTGHNEAIRCFMSPFDACIEAVQIATPDQPKEVIPVSSINRHAIRNKSPDQIQFTVHVAWRAHQFRIPVRPCGRPFATALPLQKRLQGEWISMMPDAEALAHIESIHERAGLFAWKETALDFRRWRPERVAEMAKHALRELAGITTRRRLFDECDQYALFDPEFGQWHFVPVDG